MRKKTEREARESTLASGWTVEGEVAQDPATVGGAIPTDGSPDDGGVEGAGTRHAAAEGGVDRTDGADGQLSNGVLVLLGVFGGLYLLYCWAWFVIAQAYVAYNASAIAGSGALGGVLQQAVFWAAPVAVALWFLISLLLQRHRPLRLAIWLVIGAVVLVPLPMLLSGGAS